MAWGAIAAGGASLLGGILKNDADRTRAHEAQDFSAEQYATRWQTTTKDMEAAGLNPMLAYSQGVGTSPSGVSMPSQDVISPAVQAYQAAAGNKAIRDVNSAQVANINADTDNKKSQAALIDAQTAATTASAGQAASQTAVNEQMVNKIVADTKNAGAEYERIWQMVQSIAAETGLTRANTRLADARTRTETLNWSQVQAITQKVLLETGMMNMDYEALQRLDNVGKMAKELRPVVDLIRGMTDARKASR